MERTLSSPSVTPRTMPVSHLSGMAFHNLATFRRQPWAEISGSLGDLGTFLPILIALSESKQISLPTTLILTGVYNILTGALFGIPLPVQPMKAIAAIALLKSLSAGQVAAAGIFVSACILFFSITRLLEWFTNVIPIPVVKGIQLGAGLSLIIAAGTKATSTLAWKGPSWADNYLWLIFAFTALLLVNLHPKIPFALLITGLGIVLSLILVAASQSRHLPHPQLWQPSAQLPTTRDWELGIIDAGLGQLPLTTLNSVVAVAHLAVDLLPNVESPTVTSIGLSVAAMNMLGCWFGAMPVCHGSGGLAAQYRFGARSGASIIVLGVLKLTIGLLFGESLTDLFQIFPVALLTVMVIAAGVELASVGESLNTTRARDLKEDLSPNRPTESESKQRWTTMLVTAGILVAFKNDAIGFLAGMLCHWSYQIPIYLRRHQSFHDEDNRSEEEALLSQQRL